MRTLLTSVVIAVILAVIVLYQFDKVPTDKIQNFVPASGVERLEKILKPGRVEKLEEILKQGGDYYGRSKYKEALEKWQEGLNLAAEDKKYQAIFCLEMAKIYNELGHYDQVKNMLDKANSSSESPNEEEIKMKINLQQGILYRHLGQFQDAKNSFQQALKHQTDRSLQQADILTQMGIISRDSNLEEATGFFNKAKSIYEELGYGYRRGGADILVEEGIILRDFEKQNKDQVELALAKLKGAVQPYENSDYELGKSKARAEIGRTYVQLPKYEDALESFEKAMEIDEKMDNWQGQWDTLLSMAAVYSKQGRKDDVISSLTKALEIDAKVPFSTSIRRRLADYQTSINLLLSTESADMALTVFERQQQRTLAKDFKPQSAKELRDQLSDDQMLLVYNVMNDKTLLWVVSKGRFELLTCKLSATEIKKAVDQLQSSDRDKELVKASRKLYQELLSPVFKTSTGSSKKNAKSVKTTTQAPKKPTQLYIVPTGALTDLNFEALIINQGTGKQGKVSYLVENYLSVEYLPSASLLRQPTVPEVAELKRCGDELRRQLNTVSADRTEWVKTLKEGHNCYTKIFAKLYPNNW